MTTRPDVTVVIPVYNKAAFLPALLDSLVAQKTDRVTFDVHAVDDGSTDGSGDILRRYAEQHDWLHVVHQDNSGWPGQPRNRAVDASDSRYVFFADADDYFGEEALERLVLAADELDCDVLIPRCGLERPARKGYWLAPKSLPDVPIPLRFKTLRPHKLLRRDFIEKHCLRFVEHVAPLEDGIYLARAYLLARRVSFIADYEYYIFVERDQNSISCRRRDPWAQRDSVATIIRTVRELCDDRRARNDVVLGIYNRKGIRYIGPNRLPNFPAGLRRQHVLAAADLADEVMPPKLEARLPLASRLRSRLVRKRDPEASLALAEAQARSLVPVRLTKAGRLVLDTGKARATIDVTRDMPVETTDTEVRRTGQGMQFSATLSVQDGELSGQAPVRLVATGADRVSVTLTGKANLEPSSQGGLRVSASVPLSCLAAVSQRSAPVVLQVELGASAPERCLRVPLRGSADLLVTVRERAYGLEVRVGTDGELVVVPAEKLSIHRFATRRVRRTLVGFARRVRSGRRGPLVQPP